MAGLGLVGAARGGTCDADLDRCARRLHAERFGKAKLDGGTG